jgi:predicted lipoprotein with Yx(FWY)xxD motif
MKNQRLSLPVAVLVIAAIVAVIASTGGAKKNVQGAVSAGPAVSLRQTPLGSTLTDNQGRTLYLFAGDKPNASTLSAAGRAVWPPFTSSATPRAIGGAQASRIGTITGAAGVPQVTYNGHPLYYFIGDKNPGQTAGQNLLEFGARWYVLSGAGAAITAAPKPAATNNSTGNASGGGAYGGY